MAIPIPHEKSLAIPSDPIWRLTVDQYHDMIAAGILTDDDPLELLEGWLITKMTKTPKHSMVTQLVRDVVARHVPPGWFVSTQEPLTTSDSEPEPDVMIVPGQVRDYAERHPSGQDIALVIEVSDATLKRDRELKRHIYAGAHIPAYWIVNLQTDQLEVFTDPFMDGETAGYRTALVLDQTAVVPLVIDGMVRAELSVRDLVG